MIKIEIARRARTKPAAAIHALVQIAGAVLLSCALGLIYKPAGLAAAGILMIVFGIASEVEVNNARKPDRTPDGT